MDHDVLREIERQVLEMGAAADAARRRESARSWRRSYRSTGEAAKVIIAALRIEQAVKVSNGRRPDDYLSRPFEYGPLLEGDFNWTNLKGSSPCLIIGGCHVSHDWIATATGRFGVIYDRALLYVKGGAAWTKPSYSVDFSGVGAVATSSSSGDTRVGWVFGTGIEYAFTPSWSAKIEYNYLDFGKDEVAFTLPAPTGFGVAGTLQQTMHVVKGGLNYRFGY